MANAGDLTEQTADPDPQVGLRAVSALRRLVDQLEDLQVRNARARGWSWADTAAALGVSKQAVHKKYAHLGVSPIQEGRQ